MLINSAGVLDNEPIADHSDEVWEYHYGVNVNSYFFTIREIIGEMFERGAGRVHQHRLDVEQGADRTEPSCVRVVEARGARTDQGGRVRGGATRRHGQRDLPGIRPHRHGRGQHAEVRSRLGKTPEETRAFWISKIPMGRFIDPEEVVPLVLFLVSDGAGAITMQAINVDGGFSPI